MKLGWDCYVVGEIVQRETAESLDPRFGGRSDSHLAGVRAGNAADTVEDTP